jgi:DNA-binding transcriptional ArsR family regulator
LLSPSQIRSHYSDIPLRIQRFWDFSRKHFRVVLGDGRFVKLNKFENRMVRVTRMTRQATTENAVSLEDVLCSKTRMRILKALKKFVRLNTSDIGRHVGTNFHVVTVHLRLLEEQDVLTHANFGSRSHLYRFSESPRAKAVAKLLEAWE